MPILKGTPQYDKWLRKITVASTGRLQSQETKNKKSIALKGKVRTPEHCHNISLSKIGKQPRLGAILSQETRQKISTSHKGIRLGWRHPEEVKKKIRLGNIGKNLGRHSKLLGKHLVPREGRLCLVCQNEFITKVKSSKKFCSVKCFLFQFNNRRIGPYTNTSIELKLQSILKDAGISFETHYPILGTPDIFIKPNIAIFADGCYWHKCSSCGYGTPSEKDTQITKELQGQGYTVIRLWEHEIKSNPDLLSKLLPC